MSFGDPGAEVTKYRKTVVTFDEFLPCVTQPPVQIDRPAESMGQTEDSQKTNVVYVDHIGWRLRSYQADYGGLFESSAGQAGVYSVGLGRASVASKFVESNYQRDPSLTGVTWTGPSSGFPGLQKNVGAGSTFDDSLSADATAYPSPSVSSPAEMDRVMVTTDNHKPTTEISLWFQVPGSAVTGTGALKNFFFTGPAGANDQLTGDGSYSLVLYGDGRAELHEHGYVPTDSLKTPTWSKRYAFIYEPSRQLHPFKTYIVTVVSDSWQDANGAYHGNKIVFLVNGHQDTGPQPLLSKAGTPNVDLTQKTNTRVYFVPQVTQEAVSVRPARVDSRRDKRSVFHLVKATYPTSGTLVDGVFSIDFVPDVNTDFTFEWYSRTPAGTSITCKLYDADTDAELTGSLNFVDDYGGQRTYTPNDKQRFYRVKATFTSDGNNTPTLIAWRLFRENVFETPSLDTIVIDDSRDSSTALTKARVASVDIKGQDTDPQNASATIVINDFAGLLDDLGVRDNVPVKITTTFDAPQTDTSVLFRGYTQGASYEVKRDGGPIPGQQWRQYTIPCVGEWRRLSDVLAQRRFTFTDRATDSPWKVTDLCASLLAMAYKDENIDVPDLPVRLFSVNQQQFILEPGDAIMGPLIKVAADYLGGWFVWDDNTANGNWRLLQQKTPPYNNLARFRFDHPGSGILPHVDGAYGYDTDGAQTILKTFIKKGTFSSTVERPEGNCVAVYGGAANEASGAQGFKSGTMLTQVVYNVGSYNFLNLGTGDDGYPTPTGNPDYLGYYAPIKVFDATLSTPAAVNWIARRVYDYACHGRKILTFEAPLLLVTDSTDDLQTAPRPLRFYDCVQVYDDVLEDYVQYIVRDCSPTYTKDRLQWARYELVTTSAIDTIGAVPPVKDIIRQMTRILKRTILGGSPWSPMDRNQHREFGNASSDWMGLPEPTIPAIQDLDNTSATFGGFYPMLDYDGLS